MMTSYEVSKRWAALFSLFLMTGCASVQFDDYLGDPVSPPSRAGEKVIRPKKAATEAAEVPARCGWNRVTYRGEVIFSQGPGGSVLRARVALMEGTEELCCTLSDKEGCFELACDLYGKPFTAEDGVCRWSPEEYYALVATEPGGGKGKVLLRDTPLGGRVRIALD